MKYHRVVIIKMALASASAMRQNLRKLGNGQNSAVKATALILAISLSKLKIHEVRKREIYSKDSLR